MFTTKGKFSNYKKSTRQRERERERERRNIDSYLTLCEDERRSEDIQTFSQVYATNLNAFREHTVFALTFATNQPTNTDYTHTHTHMQKVLRVYYRMSRL